MIRFVRFDIGTYMERWLLVHPWGTVRLHHIMRSDADPHPHDHPWDFWSIILWGSYEEELWVSDGEDRGVWMTWTPPRWWPRFVRAEQLHRLELKAPVWTLVFSGPARREWGFQTEDGWVHWRSFISQKDGLDPAAYIAAKAALTGELP